MTDYVKSTNFASKDSLATGNPLKIVKGTEIDTEFNNIATAVATKADLNSPTFIGTPSAPTASAGTSTTQVATTAFVGTAVTNERTATATLTNKTLTSPSLSSPAMTGTPTAPTASVDTNTTQVATTAFVIAQIADDAPTKTGSGASGTWGISISGTAATATSPASGGSFITSSNIGSQSVNYATTAGNGGVTSVNGSTGAITLGLFGVGQEWSSPSRSAGVWYQNTTGKPIMINLVLGSYQIATIRVGVSTSSYSTANYTDNDIYQVNAMSAVVPNNYYYYLDGGFSLWYELR